MTAGDVGAMELLGPGDVLVPQADETVADFVEAAVQWFALLPTQFAVLNAEVVQRLSQWPDVLATVVRRMAERSARQAVVQAICHNPRVDVRLRELFWHLAERWGRVTAGGVVLPLRLTHEALARLVGAQRPTVSTALKGLHDTGEVTRRGDGAWVLLPENPERLEGLHRRVGSRHAAIAVIHDEQRRRPAHGRAARPAADRVGAAVGVGHAAAPADGRAPLRDEGPDGRNPPVSGKSQQPGRVVRILTAPAARPCAGGDAGYARPAVRLAVNLSSVGEIDLLAFDGEIDFGTSERFETALGTVILDRAPGWSTCVGSPS